jgi:hypothetical protein
MGSCLVLGCGSRDPSDAVRVVDQPPVLVVPAGLVTTQTADAVVDKTIAAIRRDEHAFGRALGPIRILRVELMGAGQTFWANRLDGSNPNQMGLSPDGSSGWIVEALGTFLYDDPRDDVHKDVGRHGFYLWADDGGEGKAIYTCWSSMPTHALEETCEGRPLD